MHTDAFAHVRKDSGMEGMVAKWYAANTGRVRDDFVRLARRIAAGLAPESAVLEVAPGPGYFAIELAGCGAYTITGLDLSRSFVAMARNNAAEASVRIDFRQGNASDMPFADESFDFLLCRAAFKNFAHPVRALEEMHRVLKPGGRAVIIDLRKDTPPEDIDRFVNTMGLGAFSRMLTKLTFRTMLLKRAHTRDAFEQMLARTFFRDVDIRQNGIGFEIWLTK